jgi:hypothetical protein
MGDKTLTYAWIVVFWDIIQDKWKLWDRENLCDEGKYCMVIHQQTKRHNI